VPRHPPCALKNLATKIKDARVHCAVLKLRAVSLPLAGAYFASCEAVHRGDGPQGAFSEAPIRRKDLRPCPQDSTACRSRPTRCARFSVPAEAGRTYERRGCDGQLVDVPPLSTTSAHSTELWAWTPANRRQMLLRKEVIQPHLPVRLPCYDFVPIASPTFDGSLPYGLGHRLRVLPTFVT
jgi:hypothetical protein